MTSSGRPLEGEYAAYAAEDIGWVEGDDAVDVLVAQGEQFLALVATWSDARIANVTYAPGKWTLKEIIGHLVDDERIFLYRTLSVARGDRNPLPGFDENAYVAATDFEGRTLDALAAEYRAARAASVSFFRSLTPDEWLRRGMVNGYEASVRGLAFHVAGHELHHLRVIRERYLPLIT